MLELIFLLKGAFALYAAYCVVRITFELIVGWFLKRRQLKQQDKDNIAFTLKSEMEKGNYVLCQGIFNTRNGEIVDGQKLQSKEMDQELLAAHQGRSLVIYE